MVHLDPHEYVAVCGLIGPELLDSVADCRSTGEFWVRLDRLLSARERVRLREALRVSRPAAPSRLKRKHPGDSASGVRHL